MLLINDKISVEELRKMASRMFGRLVKAVVDIDKEIMLVDADLHSDEELELIELGSKQKSLWGINLYPDIYGQENWIEFDSMINLRPSWSNMTRGVDDPAIQSRIRIIVTRLVKS